MRILVIVYSLVFLGCNQIDISTIVFPDGGYVYPNQQTRNEINYYHYPIKDSIVFGRSIPSEIGQRYFYSSFQEPNLSVGYRGETVFRLVYGGPMEKSFIINLYEDRIVVKQRVKGFNYPYYDTLLLNAKERLHFNYFDRFYPFKAEVRVPDSSQTKRRAIYRQFFDSLLRVEPELRDSLYYISLLEKSAHFGEQKIENSSTSVPINPRTYMRLVNQINKSGYWKLPYLVSCINLPNDGYSFSLEAHTPKKYNIVFAIGCPDNNNSNFVKACQALIDAARINKSVIWKEY